MDTQNAIVLKHLQSGQGITSDEARDTYGVARVAARVFDLKELNHKIDKIMIKVKTRRGWTRVAYYFLKGKKNG